MILGVVPVEVARQFMQSMQASLSQSAVHAGCRQEFVNLPLGQRTVC